MSRPVKPYKPQDDLIAGLETRGMTVQRELAAQWLANVGYYRLSGYWYPYRQFAGARRVDPFVPGTSFQRVIALYAFDRKLRTLIHDGVERVEILLRTRLNETLGAIDALAHRDASNFRASFDHAKWLRTADKRVDRAQRHSDSVQHHQDDYGGVLPIWAHSEVLDFADASRLYDGLPSRLQLEVAEGMGIRLNLAMVTKRQAAKAKSSHPLARWLEQISIVRNTSAHHARLWNRTFLPAPTAAMKTMPALETLPNGQSEQLYGALSVMAVLIERASPGSSWRSKVADLVVTANLEGLGRSVEEMGFPVDWRDGWIGAALT